ncbi:MAG: fibronectin type III domain-containing protein, partial [Nonlabens sp.]
MKIKLLLFTLMSWLALMGVYAQSTIEITTNSGTCCDGEKWVNITTAIDGGGTQVWGQGDGTYSNGAGLLANEVVNLAPGTYFVNCYDQYDDSWDGATIEVTAYGSVIGNNGGLSPDDGADTDATFTWEPNNQAAELEASFQIVVPAAPTCLPVASVSTGTVTSNSVELNWVPQDASQTSFDIEVTDAGVPATGNYGFTGVTSPYVIPNLNSYSSYDFYVRANCGGGDFSGAISVTGVLTSPDCGDTIFDTGGAAGQYSNNEDYTITFFPDNAGNLAQLEFVFVGLEVNVFGGGFYDNILIYDGVDTSAPLITDEVQLVDVAGNGDAPIIYESTVPSGALTLRFTSDFTGTEDGFEVNFNCVARPSCSIPGGFTVSEGTNLGDVDLSWTAGDANAVDYEIEYVISGNAPTGTPDVIGITGTNTTINNLTQTETYDFYVRANCGGGDFSDFRGPESLRISALGDSCDRPNPIGLTLDCNNSTPYSLDFANAVDLGGVTSCDTTGTNTGAWFEFTANARETIVLKSTEAVEFAIFETCVDSPIFCESSATTRSEIVGGLTDGVTYLVAVWQDGTSTDVADICIEQGPTCFIPENLDATVTSDTTADLTWDATGTETTWDIEIVNISQGQTATGTPQLIAISPNNPYPLTGLTPSSEYEFYVRANCGGGDTSDFAGPESFRTTGPLDNCATGQTLTVVADCATATPFSLDLASAGNLGSISGCDTGGTN